MSRISPFRSCRASVLIIVMWTCLGLVALILYFANSMSAELRAADNRAVAVEARQAVAGGIRYAAYVLTHFAVAGAVPDPTLDYKSEALPVGEASFWFIGRDSNREATTDPVFGLVDENSKLNLNTASAAMLEGLPGMTPELATAIIAWRTPVRNSSGSSDNTYAGLDPPRLNKGAPFESVDELRLVYGATLDLLLGEDINRNGALDPNEDDGEQSAPRDNQDGQLQPGFLEYLTVYSRQTPTASDGRARTNIAIGQARQGPLTALLRRRGFANNRVAAIDRAVGTNNYDSVAAFFVASGMAAEEYALIHTDLTATPTPTPGLVNVNTASAAVLACIPGIGPDQAANVVAYRLAHPEALTSFAWLLQVIGGPGMRRAGTYICDESYQFSADIAAVGRYGRGYCREKVVFDLTNGTPRIVYHQDLGAYGWALGNQVRRTLRAPKNT